MRRRKWTPAARARPPVALALNPVGMSARDVVIAALNASRACFHVFRELGTTLGWSLNKLEDVLNEEGGPERLDQAYSFLQSCQRLEDRLHMDGGERTQKLEDILRKPRPGETDDEEDQDDGDADDEGGDVLHLVEVYRFRSPAVRWVVGTAMSTLSAMWPVGRCVQVGAGRGKKAR